jgi:WD40 repeat protein
LADQTIRRWNVTTGEPVGEPLHGHDAKVTSVAVSPDGTLITSASGDRTIRMWDLKTGALIGKPLEGHSRDVTSITFSPDGTKIASCSKDRTIRLWSIKTQAMIGNPFEGHSDYVNSVAFSCDGAFLVSGAGDSTVRVWNVKTGFEVCEPLEEHTSSVTSVAYAPDGIHIISGSWDRSVRVWNLAGVLPKGTATGSPAANSNDVYPHPDTAVQYPPNLFPKKTFEMRDGWILGPDKELLLWVPPVNRSGLVYPSSRSRVMGVTHITELDFSNFKCGTEWTQCREPMETE